MKAAVQLIAALAAPAGERRTVPRAMLVGAHPDDETVGAGSRLERLAHALFVCVTDGAPRSGEDAAQHGFTPQQYAQARRQELEAALGECGVPPERIVGLQCPDQEAALNLVPLARRLAALVLQEQPEVVLTHPYEGGHPDHDATAFIVHAAVALARAHGHEADIAEWTSYHRGPDGALTNEFLPAPEVDAHAVGWQLSPQEQERKQALIDLHATQRHTLRNLPTTSERFRPAPRYDFTRPPHEWKLHYENYPWGMTGSRFRALAEQALHELQLESPI